MEVKQIHFKSVQWIRVAHDRVQKWVLVRTLMNLHILVYETLKKESTSDCYVR
jgi:hypothetical protein